MPKTLVGWRHENKFSFLHLTRVFLNNLRMFNIYQPDSFLLAFLWGSMATDFEDYKDSCRYTVFIGNNYSTKKTTMESLWALNQLDSYMPPLRGCQKHWWGGVMRTSSPSSTSPAFFWTTCGCSISINQIRSCLRFYDDLWLRTLRTIRTEVANYSI